MDSELEDTLTRELHEVADALVIPAMPELPAQSSGRSLWQPLLVAAVAVLIALSAVAIVTGVGDDRRIVPAPSPSPSPSAVELASTPTMVPHLVGPDLFIGGEQVAGRWSFVEGGADTWVGGQLDGSYWWGIGTDAQRFEDDLQQPPALSPDGSLRAWMFGPGAALRAAETTGGPVRRGPAIGRYVAEGVAPWVPAVTDDGLVVARGADRSFVWRPWGDNFFVELGDSAPGQTVVDSTAAGLVVVDGGSDAREGEVYLGTMDEQGAITRGEDLPNHDELAASTDWLAWIEAGTMGGEAGTAAELLISRVDGSGAGVLAPPEGWAFRGFTLRWEDPTHLVATVRNAQQEERMVRCSPVLERCVLLDNP